MLRYWIQSRCGCVQTRFVKSTCEVVLLILILASLNDGFMALCFLGEDGNAI